MVYTAHYTSPIGGMLLAGRDGKLIGLWLEGQKYYLGSLKEELKECSDLPVFIQAKNWLDRYFSGEKPLAAELDLAPEGSSFQREVWKILCEIPYGQVTTYGEIAKKIAQKRMLKSMSAQAVGGAVARNPISVIIPCHRVVGSDKSLTGYAGGIDKKRRLLALEGIIAGKTPAMKPSCSR